MAQDARERTAAFFEQPAGDLETVPADWDVDATVQEFLAIEPDTNGLQEANVANRNMRRRGLAGYVHLPALRSESTMSWSMYASGSQVVTANATAATTFALAEMLRNSWAGLHLGFANLVVVASTTVPEVTAAQGASHPAGSAVFGVNAATGAGEFLIVDSVAGDVLTLRTTASATVDSIGAALQLFPHSRALFNRDNALHITHAMYWRGEEADDNYEVRGAKLNVTGMENTESGGDAAFTMEAMAADFVSDGLARAALTDAPQGPAGPVVGRTGTAVRMADFGDPAIVDVGAHSFEFAPGITNARVPGITGTGLLGYHCTGGDDTQITIIVNYDEDLITDYEAGTLKHIMIQVGDVQSDAWAIYFPRCQIMQDPGRGSTSEETTMTLVLQALEFEGTTFAEGTDGYERERARFSVLLGA